MMQYNTFPLQSYNQPSHSSPIEVPGRHSGTSPIAVVKTEEDEGGISPMALHTNSGNGTGVQAIPIASWMSGPQVNINSLQTLSLPATPFPAHATPQPHFASNATTRQPTPIGEDGLCALLGQDQGIVFNPPDSAVDDSNRAGNDGGGRKRSAGAKSDTSMKSRSSKRSRGSGGTTRSAKVRAVAESRGPTFMIKLYALLENPKYQHLLHWDESGTELVIEDPQVMEKTILKEVYDHSKFASFTRQLNIYGWMRKGSTRTGGRTTLELDPSVWAHAYFTSQSTTDELLSYKRRVQPRNYSTRAKANALATQRNAMRIGSGRVGMDDAPMHQHASYGGSPGFQSSFSQSALARLRREEYLSPPGPRSPTSPTSGWQNSDGMYEQGGQPVLPTFSPLMQSQPIGAYPYRDEQSPSYSSSPVDTPSPHFHPQSRADPITSPLNYRLYSGSPLVAMNDTPYDLEQGSSPQAVSRSNGIKQRWNTHPQLSSSYMSHASSSPTFNAYGGETYAPTTGDEGMTLIHTPPNFGSAGPQREYGSPKAMQVDPSFTGLGLDIYNPYQKPSFPYRQPASRKHMATSGLANEVRHQGIEADDDADMEATMTATHGARPLEDFEGLDGLWLNGMMVDHDPMEAL